MDGIERPDTIGTDRPLIVTASSRQAESPGVHAGGGTSAVHDLIGAVIAKVLAILHRPAHQEVADLKLKVGVRVLRLLRIVDIRLLVEAERVCTADSQTHSVEVMGEPGGHG